MLRREVVVANQVFDLGLQELAETVANKDGRWPTVDLDVGEKIFQCGFVTNEQAFILNWWGMTNMQNIVWTRFVFLRLRWPFIKKVDCFTYAMEGA